MLFPVLLVLGVIGLLTTLGGIYLRIGKSRSVERLRERAAAECKWRLECVAPSLDGKVDGPTMRTAQGTIELIPSGAPSSWVIDMTTFDTEVAFTHVLNVVAHRDTDRAGRSKLVRPVDLEDPKVASGYRVFSSDADFARAVVTAELIQATRALDAAVRARTFLRTGGGRATVVALRGLSDAAELKAFHDGSAALVGLLKMSEGPTPAP